MNLFQHFTVLLVLSAMTLLIAEAQTGRNKKRKGKKVTCMDEKKQNRRPGKRVTVCPLNCTNTNRNGTLAANKHTSIVVENKLNATRAYLAFLDISLKELVDAKSSDSNADEYAEYGIKELNPKDETKLSSDEEFRLLGQMTWWLTWIEASLRILQEIRQRVEDKKLNPNDIVPVVEDTDNGIVFTINSTLEALLTVKSSVNDLHSMLGHDIDATAKNSPFSCQEVRVKQECRRKDPNCSKERIRAYIVLRDSHKAVEKMLKALSECKVEKKDKKFALVCKRYVIFLKCQKTLRGLQKKRPKCLSWTYE